MTAYRYHAVGGAKEGVWIITEVSRLFEPDLLGEQWEPTRMSEFMLSAEDLFRVHYCYSMCSTVAAAGF